MEKRKLKYNEQFGRGKGPVKMMLETDGLDFFINGTPVLKDDYHEYKQHTPMLLPTLSSVRRFLTTRVTTNGV